MWSCVDSIKYKEQLAQRETRKAEAASAKK